MVLCVPSVRPHFSHDEPSRPGLFEQKPQLPPYIRDETKTSHDPSVGPDPVFGDDYSRLHASERVDIQTNYVNKYETIKRI